ncbi:chitinase, partial [Vibrio cholerae]
GSFMRPGQCDGSGVDENGEAYKGPAYTADNGIQLLLAQGVPANKLVLGTAMYGRGWEGVTPDTLTDPNDPMTGTATGKLKGSTAQGV